MKIYLQAGDSLTLHIVGHLGRGCKLTDVIPDAYETIKYGGDDKDTYSAGDGVGRIVRDGITYDIHVDLQTYRLWYDDDGGY